MGEDKVNCLSPDLIRSSGKHNDHNDKASSFYQKNVKSSHGDKLFDYHEPIYKIILWKKFKFTLPNLDKKYDGITESFDHTTNYQVAMHPYGATDEGMFPDFAMTP